MKVPDRNLQELREQGFTIVEGFLAPDELKAAQEALWLHYPRPEDYFADPSAHDEYTRSQFDGIARAPWQSWDLNRLAFHPDLVDLAERFLGSADLHLYNALLWAKYAGAIDYEQVHHRDFVNHSLVVPNRGDPGRQMTSFVLLSDVDEDDGPTKVVPLEAGATRPYWPKGGDEDFAGGTGLDPGAFAEVEVAWPAPPAPSSRSAPTSSTAARRSPENDEPGSCCSPATRSGARGGPEGWDGPLTRSAPTGPR